MSVSMSPKAWRKTQRDVTKESPTVNSQASVLKDPSDVPPMKVGCSNTSDVHAPRGILSAEPLGVTTPTM